MKQEKERTVFYDLIKIIAIWLILYNHRRTYWGVPDYSIVNIKLVLFSIMAFICKFGAALFFMVSGGLLLGKFEEIGYIFK